ncbi:protein ITPRID1 isoform 3-T13 [Anomaloglossus baeobatrachus]
MEDSELNSQNGSTRPPGMKNTKHTDLNIPNNNKNKSSKSVEGSICRMEIIKLSVKDYMSSLHNYIETFPTSKRNGTIQTAPSIPTSISDMLKRCEADPVDLLIDLGFGVDEPDICNKIPSRFIMTPSEARGINTRVFLEAQKKRMEIENPNLCGRFRQLEVLEQVTSAFSTLLNNIHTTQNNGGQKTNSERKSTLTPEKRRRIRQLLWKFSKQVKIVDEGVSPAITKAEPEVPRQEETQPGSLEDSSNLKVFRKRKHCTEETHSVTLPNGNNRNLDSMEEQSDVCSLSSSIKPSSYIDMAGKIRTLKGSKVLSKTMKKTAQQRLQAPDPESFEMEEVLSFEEDCPRAVKQDSISEMTRTNSCQSDSSGFQEEPPEPLPLQNLHESSDSNDSQTTLREKADVSIFTDEGEEYDEIGHFAEMDTSDNTAICEFKTLKEKSKSLSMDTEQSDDVFQSFDSQTDNIDKDNMREIESQEPPFGDSRNEERADIDSCLLQYELNGSVSQDQAQSPEVPSEVDFPVYLPHYISDINPESPGEIDDSLMPDFSEESNTDQDVENMKKACQKYREKLIYIEQCLTEQQAGCYHIFTREERENMRGLQLLRQNVLKEALELEYNLDARARQLKETISVQLEEVLEEQSRLYSELELYNCEQDRSPVEHYGRLHRTNSLPSTSSCTVNKEDQGTPVNQGETITQSQKIDLSTFLQNIKKTFQRLNNS